MSSGKLLGSLLALSIAWSASAQTAAQKPKPPAKKATVPVKPADKAPVPAAAPAPPAPPPPVTDVKIQTRYVTGAQVSENTTYMKGVRQRFEFPGVTMITQCDLNRSLQLHDATKHFMVVPTETPGAQPAAAAATPDPQAAAKGTPMPSAGGPGATQTKPQGGVIAETITLTDTGERKPLFGLEARHIKTLTVRQPGPKACESKVTRVETDGWYADLPERASCPAAATPTPPSPPAAQQACTDRIETQHTGEAKLGFALSTAITTTVEEGKDKDVTTMTMEVADLRVMSLEAALFDVPPGYTEVKNYKDLLPSLSGGGSLADAVFGSLADGTSTVAPKKPGVIRIGIVDPIDKSGRSMPTPMLRGGLMASLSKAPFEALPVAGATPADLDRDATGKACDFILVTDIAEVKTSKPNKVGGALRRVSGDANAASEIHDARVDYKLYAVGDQTKPKATATVKASSGGGFGVGSALRVAAFAGQMYMTMGMGMGSGMGMMGMMGQASAFGGLGGMGGGLSGLMNPGMGAAMSIMSGGAGMAMPGGMAGMMGDASSQKVTETVQDALSKAGKQVAEELKKGKSPANGEKK